MVSEGSDILSCVLWENIMVGKVWCGKAVHTTVDRKQRKTGRGQGQGIPKDPPLMTDLLSPTEPTSLISTSSQNVIINWENHSISKPQHHMNFKKLYLGAGEITRWLRAFVDCIEDPILVPLITVGSLHLPVMPVSRDLTSSSFSLPRHPRQHAQTYVQTHMQAHN